MKKPLVLFGNGQVAAATCERFRHDTDYQIVAFTVDGPYLKEPTFLGLPVIAFEDLATHYPPDEVDLHISISYRGVNRLRAEKFTQSKEKGYALVNYISSRAVVDASVTLGENCIIGANSIVDPFVEIGDNVVIAAGTVIGHHTRIGNHCFIGAGAAVSGSVQIEDYCFVGTGAVVRDRLTLRSASVIGAGAVILEDTVEKGVYLARAAQRLPILSDQLPLG